MRNPLKTLVPIEWSGYKLKNPLSFVRVLFKLLVLLETGNKINL